MNIIQALGSLANQRCFILYKLFAKPGTWKLDKVPVSEITGHSSDAQDPATHLTAHEALMWATTKGLGTQAGHYGVGIVLSEALGIFCIDLDDCLDLTTGQWHPNAVAVCQRFPGAARELSVSGRALHILGRHTGPVPPHSMKCAPLKMEAYDKLRFIALTGDGWDGSIDSDHTAAYHQFLVEYFPPRHEAEGSQDWTTEPVPQWSGPEDDGELVNRALRSHGAGSVFGGKASFRDLWTGNADRLAASFPDQSGAWPWDRSGADQALANHLAFWTGNNCERIQRIMLGCEALRRDKWEREDYIPGTIIRATSTQKQWYKDRSAPKLAETPATLAAPVTALVATVPLAGVAGSLQPVYNTDQGRAYPETVTGPGTPAPAVVVAPISPDGVKPGFPTGAYVDPGAAPAQAAKLQAIAGVIIPEEVKVQKGVKPPVGSLLTSTDQAVIWDGYVFVEDIKRIMTPEGLVIDAEQFDSRFSGLTFITTPDGTKPTKSAWEAFVNSEVHEFPKVRGLFFAPREPAGTTVMRDGMPFLNSFVPVTIASTPGDYSPFWNHLKKLLPRSNDAEILLYYMAAIIQNPGVKFTWWPFIQGVPGNGKSFLCEALQRCVGEKFTHAADASKIGGRFNAAFYGKLFVRLDEVKMDHQRGSSWESLKLLITQTTLEVEAKGIDSVSREMCFNGMMLSNYKNGVRKTPEDRRIAPFFCAQQTLTDLYTQGMVDDPEGEASKYFDALWSWAENGGWEVIRWFLANITIPDQLNPAKSCRRAPTTTSTREAIMAGWGVAEQEVVEAISQGYEGFRGGWVNSVSLDRLLAQIGKENAIPRQARAQLMTNLGYQHHPALAEGRSPVKMPDGSQPVLWVKAGHGALALGTAQVLAAFQEAQRVK